MSGEYEKSQAHLQKLWNEMLSESEEEPFEGGSSDEYNPESESENSSDGEIVQRKRMKR